MRRILLFFISCISSFISSEIISNQIEGRIFTIDNNKQETYICSQLDQEFFLKLESQPSTGFGWFLIYNSNEENLIAYDLYESGLSKLFISDKEDPFFVGAKGHTYFRFKGIKKGRYVLELIYKRAWEPEENGIDITIKVRIH